MRYKAVRCAVEAVTAYLVFLAYIIRKRVGVGVIGHCLVESRVVNEHLLYFRQVFLYCKVAFQSRGVVQRCEFAVVLEVADYLGGDNHAVR